MLSDNIRIIRKNRGFTQEELAARLHVTRQTVSKWEKGYSVPDADLLSRMAEELEVPVAELLGEPAQSASDPDPIVEQLSRLNEQLVIKNRRAGRIWKIVGIALGAIVLIWLILAALGAVDYSSGPQSAAGSIDWACTLNGEVHTCGVNYDGNYRIVSGYTEDFFMEKGIDPMDGADARQVQTMLYDWFEENGGTVEVIRQEGLPLPEAGAD